MRIDGHIHIHPENNSDNPLVNYNQKKFIEDLGDAGFDGAAIYSPSPIFCKDLSFEKRMDICLEACEGNDNLFPFYWIDPTEEDALQQVDIAVEKGFAAFKMICSNYRVDCNQSMDVISKIATTGKAIMFHSGILWDGYNSANNNRPGNFEVLLDVPNLRFCLAHVSWPWCDECIAVFGKFNNAYHRRPDLSCEMFVDITPGTPPSYREEVFRHMLLSYNFRNNLIFGTDSAAENYNTLWSKKWQEIDNALYEKYVEEDVDDFKQRVYGKNFLRFIGLDNEKVKRDIPMVGQ